jgi:hypothetical protein
MAQIGVFDMVCRLGQDSRYLAGAEPLSTSRSGVGRVST